MVTESFPLSNMSGRSRSNDSESSFLLGIELRSRSNTVASTDDLVLVPPVDRIATNRKNYTCCVWASVLLLLTIYASYDYAWHMAHNYEVFPVPDGSRFQIESYSHRRFIHMNGTKVNIKEKIPWLQEGSFEAVKSTERRYGFGDDNSDNSCFRLRSMSNKWLSVRSQGRGGDGELLLTEVEEDSTLFASITKRSFDFSQLKATTGSGLISRWPTYCYISQLKVCNKDSWITATDDGKLVAVSGAAVLQNVTASVFQLGILQPLRGVNLGGWFVPEEWMTPQLFDNTSLVAGGGSLCALVNYSRPLAEERMAAHLQSWIAEEDLRQMAFLGLNSIRVPIGYWNIIADPYQRYAPQDLRVSLGYLDWLMATAHQYNLSVLIDLHGAPGSQNGMDNSGCGPDIEWDTPTNVDLTVAAVSALAKRYSRYSSLLGVELLNEPSFGIATYHHSDLEDFYRRAYAAVRQHCASCLVVFNELYADNFHLWTDSSFLLDPSTYNVVLDLHLYDWMGGPGEGLAQHIADAQSWASVIDGLSRSYPVVVGEWSMSTGEAQSSQLFVDASLTSFRRALGWFVWTWKTGNSAEYPQWDVQYQYGQRDGLRIV